MPTTTTTKTAEATAEGFRALNERVLDAGKKVGGAYLDAYEKTFALIADYQQKLAKQSDVELVSSVIDAQASFTRELTKLQVSAGRELLK